MQKNTPSKRDLFLKSFTYPSANGDNIFQLPKSSNQKLKIAGRFKFDHLSIGNQKVPILISPSLLLGKSPYLWSDILVTEDLVEVQGAWNGTTLTVVEINLVAPNLLVNESNFINFDVEDALLDKWNKFVRDIKNYFHQKGFLEIETPSLVICPGTEPSLEPFFTELKKGSKNIKLSLPTSPELNLKKALSAGFTKIFEIKNCFRNDEMGDHHLNEFHMLEWYRGFDNLKSIEQDLVDLVRTLKPQTEIKRYSISQLWIEYLKFNLTPQTSLEELIELCGKFNIKVHPTDSWNDLYFRIFLENIEPYFKSLGPLIIYNFPPSQAALARFTQDGWADRFEFYMNGLEIANAFHELNDPEEQRKRFQKDLEEKKHLNKSEIQIDQDFLQALDYGMPPSGGIALGLERLFMALNNIDRIHDIKLFREPVP